MRSVIQTAQEVGSKLPKVARDVLLTVAAISLFASFADASRLSKKTNLSKDTNLSKKDKSLTSKERVDLLKSLISRGDGKTFDTTLKNGNKIKVEQKEDGFRVVEVIKDGRRKFTGDKNKIEANARFFGSNLGEALREDLEKIYKLDGSGALSMHSVAAVYQITDNNQSKFDSQIYAYFIRDLGNDPKVLEALDKRLRAL